MGGSKDREKVAKKRKRPKDDASTEQAHHPTDGISGGERGMGTVPKRGRKHKQTKGTQISKAVQEVQGRSKQITGKAVVSSNWQALASVRGIHPSSMFSSAWYDAMPFWASPTITVVDLRRLAHIVNVPMMVDDSYSGITLKPGVASTSNPYRYCTNILTPLPPFLTMQTLGVKAKPKHKKKRVMDDAAKVDTATSATVDTVAAHKEDGDAPTECSKPPKIKPLVSGPFIGYVGILSRWWRDQPR